MQRNCIGLFAYVTFITHEIQTRRAFVTICKYFAYHRVQTNHDEARKQLRTACLVYHPLRQMLISISTILLFHYPVTFKHSSPNQGYIYICVYEQVAHLFLLTIKMRKDETSRLHPLLPKDRISIRVSRVDTKRIVTNRIERTNFKRNKWKYYVDPL